MKTKIYILTVIHVVLLSLVLKAYIFAIEIIPISFQDFSLMIKARITRPMYVLFGQGLLDLILLWGFAIAAFFIVLVKNKKYINVIYTIVITMIILNIYNCVLLEGMPEGILRKMTGTGLYPTGYYETLTFRLLHLTNLLVLYFLSHKTLKRIKETENKEMDLMKNTPTSYFSQGHP